MAVILGHKVSDQKIYSGSLDGERYVAVTPSESDITITRDMKLVTKANGDYYKAYSNGDLFRKVGGRRTETYAQYSPKAVKIVKKIKNVLLKIATKDVKQILEDMKIPRGRWVRLK